MGRLTPLINKRGAYETKISNCNNFIYLFISSLSSLAENYETIFLTSAELENYTIYDIDENGDYYVIIDDEIFYVNIQD